MVKFIPIFCFIPNVLFLIQSLKVIFQKISIQLICFLLCFMTFWPDSTKRFGSDRIRISNTDGDKVKECYILPDVTNSYREQHEYFPSPNNKESGIQNRIKTFRFERWFRVKTELIHSCYFLIWNQWFESKGVVIVVVIRIRILDPLQPPCGSGFRCGYWE